MKQGVVTVNVRPIRNDDGTYDHIAEYAYNLSDEEREILDSMTDDERNELLEEINKHVNSEAYKRAYEAAELYVLFGELSV